MNILHISDIHFGRNYSRYHLPDRFTLHKAILDELIDTLAKLDDSLKPEHIVFTGDIAWRGQKDEFDEALVFFHRLLDALHLTGKDISFCIGNHDIDRNYRCIDDYLNNNTIQEIDDIYRYENVPLMEPAFREYNNFCRALGVVPYCYPVNGERHYSYSVGYRDVSFPDGGTLRILAFNTSFLASQEHISSDKLWLGKPQIEALEEYGIIPAGEDISYTMALFHHSERFLHPNETNTYEGRLAPLPIIMDKADLLLCGHSESAGKPRLTRQRGGGYMLLGGATYYNDDHQNSFSMLYVTPKGKRLGFIPYIFDEGHWTDYDFMGSLRRHSERRTLPAEGKIYENARLICRCGKNESYSFPLSYLEDRDGVLHNRKDVLRSISLFYDGKLFLSPANDASFDLDTFFAYQELCEKQYASFDILDSAGAVLLHTEDAAFAPVPAYDTATLTDLQLIQDFFHVKLSLPNSGLREKDLRRISYLREIARNGYDKHPSLSGDDERLLDQDAMQKVYDILSEDGEIYLLREQMRTLRVLHVDIPMPGTIALRGPYRVDLDDLRYKLESYRSGDRRLIRFTAAENVSTYFIPDTPEREMILSRFQYITVESDR